MGNMILLYTNGNREISTGHLRRCLTIAGAIAEEGGEAAFVVSDTESEVWLTDYMRASGQEYPILKTDGYYLNPEEETDKLLSFVREKNADFLLMDSYYVKDDFWADWKARGGCAIGMIDDFGIPRPDEMWKALDLVVNYDFGEPTEEEDGKKVPLYRSVRSALAGCAYAPLRPSFREARFSVWEEATRLMVTTGGGDPYGISEAVVRECLRSDILRDMEIHVIVGAAYDAETVERLFDMTAKSKNLVIHREVRDMASEMIRSDLFVSAAGTTLYELCTVGVPGVSFIMEDNQINAAVQFEEAGLIHCAGDIRADKDGVVGALVVQIEKLKQDLEGRKRRSEAMRKAVDGKGAGRIAKEILRLIEEDKA